MGTAIRVPVKAQIVRAYTRREREESHLAGMRPFLQICETLTWLVQIAW